MRRFRMAIIFLFLGLWPFQCCANEYINIKELQNQIKCWDEQYTDKFGRKVSVDITPIIGKIERVPILRVEKPLITQENVYDAINIELAEIVQEDTRTIWNYTKNNEQITIYVFSGEVLNSIQINYDNASRNRSSSTEIEKNNESYYCSNEINMEKPYLGEGSISVQECMDIALPKINTYFKDYDLDYEIIWLDVVKNSRSHYRCTLRQRFENIPVLMGAGDPVFGLSSEDAGFLDVASIWQEGADRWGDFVRPNWELTFYEDKGFGFRATPLKKINEIYDDIPLSSIDKVIRTIEDRISQGYIRNIYALRFGYCCYLSENDATVLFPIWEVECTYFYRPKEGDEYTREYDDVPYTNELNYHTMIINAQTGEFMDPLELKEKLLYCPEIITWDDV